MSIELFKETIINIVGNIENYKKSSVIEFKKCAFKKEIIQIETEIKIEPKKKEDQLQTAIKKIVKAKSLFYFDESIDNKILEEYNDQTNNIMMISSNHNIEVYKIVSLLVHYKIIEKRDHARGYDIYKTTEEYTSKIKEKK